MIQVLMLLLTNQQIKNKLLWLEFSIKNDIFSVFDNFLSWKVTISVIWPVGVEHLIALLTPRCF